MDAEDEEEYFEFSLRQDPMTEDIALFITDFVDAGDEADAVGLWDKQIEMLHRLIGA